MGVQILAHNLDPALRWVGQHRQALEQSNKEFASGAFEFQLHQLQFLHCLSTQGDPCRAAHLTQRAASHCCTMRMPDPSLHHPSAMVLSSTAQDAPAWGRRRVPLVWGLLHWLLKKG